MATCVPKPICYTRSRLSKCATTPGRADSEQSWTVQRSEIAARSFDLKAVNPHAKQEEDTRTPEELLNLIEAKGREVAEALAALRHPRL